MKKILISTMFLTNFFCFKAQEIQESHKIYCAPSLEKCLENLFKLKVDTILLIDFHEEIVFFFIVQNRK